MYRLCVVGYQQGKNSLKIKMKTEKLKGPWALREFRRQLHSESKSNVQNGLETALVEGKKRGGEYKLL